MNILVSACLLGENCKYNGQNNFKKEVAEIAKKHKIIPICPEFPIGIPRAPIEIKNGQAINQQNYDVTEQLIKEGKKIIKLACDNNCKIAILKKKSPSCGKGQIYDGTFTHNLINGNGIVCQMLLDNGIQVYTEDEIGDLKL